MLTSQRRLVLMGSILKRAKILAASRVPKADPTGELVAVWAEELPLERFPEMLWKDAVKWWADHSGDKHLEPGDLKRAAFAVAREVWETNPAKRQALQAHRAQLTSERVHQGELPPGTTPAIPPKHSAPQVHGRRWSDSPQREQHLTRREEHAQKHAHSPADGLKGLDRLLTWAHQQNSRKQAPDGNTHTKEPEPSPKHGQEE